MATGTAPTLFAARDRSRRGYVTAGNKVVSLQGGILQLKDTKRELLFVTLDKSGKSFSPTTRYRDHASSPSSEAPPARRGTEGNKLDTPAAVEMIEA